MTKKETYKQALLDIGFTVYDFHPDILVLGHASINLDKIDSLQELLKQVWRQAMFQKQTEIQNALGI